MLRAFLMAADGLHPAPSSGGVNAPTVRWPLRISPLDLCVPANLADPKQQWHFVGWGRGEATSPQVWAVHHYTAAEARAARSPHPVFLVPQEGTKPQGPMTEGMSQGGSSSELQPSGASACLHPQRRRRGRVPCLTRTGMQVGNDLVAAPPKTHCRTTSLR